MEYLGHREGREERGAFCPVAWVGVSAARSHCQEVTGRVTFCGRLKVPGWTLPPLRSVMIMTISTDIQVARVPRMF